MQRHKQGIGLKITVIVAAATLIFLIVSVGLSYFCLFDPLKNEEMNSRKAMASLMSGSITGIIDSQAEFVKVSVSTEALRWAVESSNSKYNGTDAEAAKRSILSVDSEWLKSADDHPSIQEFLGNRASLFLRSTAEQGSGLFNIVVADRYGALVGASYRAPSIYCGNEDWFRGIVSGTNPGILCKEAILDEPSGKWAFPIVSAIINDKGEVIGAYKALMDISALSKPLEGFGVGKGGKAVLVDGRGYLIFYPGIKPFSNKFCEYNELKKLLSVTSGYSVIETAYMGKGKTAVAFSPITSPILSNKGIRLYVIVSESSRELFYPLNRLAFKIAVFSMILALLVLIAAWAVFKSSFTSPVRKLLDDVKRLGEGKLDSRVNIKTGDEMEDLGTALNNAAQNLGHIMSSIKMLDKERAECKITQERFEKESIGLLSLMTQIHRLLLDVDKGVETATQEAVKSKNDKQRMELESLRSRSSGLIKSLEKEIYAVKIETGNLVCDMQPKDFRDIIKESVFAFEPAIREKGLSLKLDIPAGKLNICADAQKIKLIFTILVDDAVRFTNKGVIEIAVKELHDSVECSVSDTGEGIPAELQKRIFDRHQMREVSTQGPEAGRSLGLFIAKGIIEMHKGKIWVTSDPQTGTKFTFILPKYTEDPQKHI